MRDTAKTHFVEIMRPESVYPMRPTRFAFPRAKLRETIVSSVLRFFADISAAMRDTAKTRSAEAMRPAKMHPDRPTRAALPRAKLPELLV